MASGWSPDGAVQDQIDDTITDEVMRARARMPTGHGASHCVGGAAMKYPQRAAWHSPACANLRYVPVGARSPSGKHRLQPPRQQGQPTQVSRTEKLGYISEQRVKPAL